jgi:hypothetical protein
MRGRSRQVVLVAERAVEGGNYRKSDQVAAARTVHLREQRADATPHDRSTGVLQPASHLVRGQGDARRGKCLLELAGRVGLELKRQIGAVQVDPDRPPVHREDLGRRQIDRRLDRDRAGEARQRQAGSLQGRV